MTSVATNGPATFLPTDPLLHVLRRATYGPTPTSVAQIRRMGATAWLEQQLSPATIADPVADELVARFPLGQLGIAAAHAAAKAGTFPPQGWEPMRAGEANRASRRAIQ